MQKKQHFVYIFLFLFILPALIIPQELYDSFAEQRSSLISGFEKKYPGKDKKIFQALSSVKREDFLPEKIKKYAYIDISIPLEWAAAAPVSVPASSSGTASASAAASAPASVISHSDLLKILINLQKPDKNKALVIGRGAGFTASVLSSLYTAVFLIETDIAESNKYQLFMPEKYPNITVQYTKELNFFKSGSPFDLIVINGSFEDYSGEFIEDLSENGELFFALSDNDGFKMLYRAEKKGESYTIKAIDEVIFPSLN
ncbi:MAG: hypothetical protein RBT69_07005 [Spirochaetia bacterium]|jgi:protein-L-isoaspartate O-methyltransferase|nr:hypothetical protein [Spirochaetia bacterium]